MLKCLEKDSGNRYPTAKELAEDLRRFHVGEVIHSAPSSRAEYAWRWCRRYPLVAGLTATVGLLLVAGTVVSSYFAKIASDRAEQHRRMLYISDMNVAQQSWEDGNVSRVRQLLKRYDDTTRASDLRKSEWFYLWREWNKNRQFRQIGVEEMPISLSLFGDETNGLLADRVRSWVD